ncbi:hypothetical protein [Methylobacterium iners]|uniref:Outer membrane protein beta-barrel domain-containing protein n=1 Tax=Methylobacterium iners TaxID=418707 RepID=A0ABQ4RW13_9HYPH|nr:hypothetical protein [Methylobacterium iners]GJD94811.1 hypothetical protein OCOJLMKI_2017 [Methylobacterium iners]
MNRAAPILAALVLMLQPVLAADVDTENLFGFTEGADTGEEGEQDVFLDTIGRFGKRKAGPGSSRYGVADTKLSYQYDPTGNFSIELGVYGDARRVRNIADLDDKAFATFDGVEVDLKYQFLKGSKDQPFGLAIETRPRFARTLPIEGTGANIFDVETLLQADLQIVPDKVWLGANLSFEGAAGRLRGSGLGDRSSLFTVSNALSVRVGENTFLGPEMRYLRAYDGSYLNRFEGHAVFVGAGLHHRFTEKTFVTLAYAGQVWGRDRDPASAGRSFDLAHFERHNVRVKLGVMF